MERLEAGLIERLEAGLPSVWTLIINPEVKESVAELYSIDSLSPRQGLAETEIWGKRRCPPV